jgi:para-nitrobenzyl esterase
VFGAALAFDPAFLFGNFGPSLFGRVIAGDANRAGRMALSQAMMDSLGAFARRPGCQVGAVAQAAVLRCDRKRGDHHRL